MLAFAISVAVVGALSLVFSVAAGGRSRWFAKAFGAAVSLSFLSIGLLVANASGPSLLFIAVFLAVTAVLTAASFRRLIVPTAEGWKRRDEIAGLKLFLGVAETDRLRVLNPPDFTPALYEVTADAL